MALKVANIKVCSPLKFHQGLTGKRQAIGSILIFNVTKHGEKDTSLYIKDLNENLVHLKMEKQNLDKDKLIKYWSDSSDDDFDTMIAMFERKKFNWALFIGHLMIEKLLKALYLKTNNDYPPFIHNLLRIAEKCNLELSDDQKLFLVTVTAFNINARYDDYKMSFQQKCTPEFTATWIENLKINRQWIKKLIQ